MLEPFSVPKAILTTVALPDPSTGKPGDVTEAVTDELPANSDVVTLPNPLNDTDSPVCGATVKMQGSCCQKTLKFSGDPVVPPLSGCEAAFEVSYCRWWAKYTETRLVSRRSLLC